MKTRLKLANVCQGVGILAVAYALTGCGGASYNSDSNGVHTGAADPYIFAYADNVFGNEASGLGVSSTTLPPAATDVFYFTYASANSAPNNTLTGSGPFATGLAQGQGATVFGNPGSFVVGTTVPAAPVSSTVTFRAQGIQGQTASRTVPNITSVTLTEPSGTTVPFGFAYTTETAAAGPFVASPYAVAVTTPATSGVYTYKATVTDAIGQTTTTTFESVVLASGFSAIASASSLSVTGATPTVTYGPDASGTTVLILPAGTYNVSVGGAAAAPVTTTSGKVSIE